MPRANPHRPFEPDPEFLALLPETFGNAVNGLGETKPRRPSMVWWAPDMDAVDFGPAQKWFYGHEPPDPRLMEQRARRLSPCGGGAAWEVEKGQARARPWGGGAVWSGPGR